MSQNTLVKPTAKQALFSLNMRNLNDLFPGFAQGDFAVIYGSPSVVSLTSMLCIRAQLPTQLGGLNSSVVFIDGGNTFRLYQVSRLAQLHHLDPKRTLERIYISRAFTAYQMTSLIMEHLKEAVEKYTAKVVIISDIAGLFLDKDIPDEEAEQVLSQVASYLQTFARQNRIIIVATCPSRQNGNRGDYLKTVTCQKANVVISLKQTLYDREFTLEKHPHFILGSAEFPSENLTLTDFFETDNKKLTFSHIKSKAAL
jgi:predicted ATP-dependent serine protease